MKKPGDVMEINKNYNENPKEEFDIQEDEIDEAQIDSLEEIMEEKTLEKDDSLDDSVKIYL